MSKIKIIPIPPPNIGMDISISCELLRRVANSFKLALTEKSFKPCFEKYRLVYKWTFTLTY